MSTRSRGRSSVRSDAIPPEPPRPDPNREKSQAKGIDPALPSTLGTCPLEPCRRAAVGEVASDRTLFRPSPRDPTRTERKAKPKVLTLHCPAPSAPVRSSHVDAQPWAK